MICVPKFFRTDNFENVGKSGKVYSKTKVNVASNLFQYSRKIPYTNILIDIEGNLVFGLIESDISIGKDVKAVVGKLGTTKQGLHIHGPLWTEKKEFSKPEVKVAKNKRELPKEKIGIEGYGTYVPRYRLDLSTIGNVWGGDFKGIKSFPGAFEDQASYACNSALSSLEHSGIEKKNIGFIEVGSESKIYSVKPTASIIAGLLGISKCFASDLEFACKAGTQAMVNSFNFVKVNGGFGLAIGSDSAQGAPNDALELTAGDASTAYIFGNKNPIAVVEGYESYTTDTTDFWRNEGEKFPKHAGRFSGEPAYYKHTMNAAKLLFEKLKFGPADFDYVIFHQPNGKFPRVVGKKLGFSDEQVEPGIVFDWIGNTYSANSLTGLAKVLDMAAPYQRILVVSYGSGAGSDSISLVTTPAIDEKRKNISRSVKSWIGEVDKENLIVTDYPIYLRNKGII